MCKNNVGDGAGAFPVLSGEGVKDEREGGGRMVEGRKGRGGK